MPEPQRVAACRLMLLKLGADTGEPTWSSWALDRLLQTAMSTPGGSITDVPRALVDVFREFQPELTQTLARFIKELVVQSWVQYPQAYKTADFRWLAHDARHRPRSATAYLALYALPADLLPEAQVMIREALEPTAFREEAIRNLEREPVG